MVDRSALALGSRGQQGFLNDLGQRRGLALDRTGQRITAQSAKAHGANFGALAGRQWKAIVIHHEKYAVPLDDRAVGGKVQGNDRDILQVNVLPNIQLGPIGNGEYTDALAFVRGGVVETPKLGALILRVPAMLRRAK